ncbi:MAG: UDP-galactopyranose mutase [Lachnospiraceae bacterium]|nr:UDP-galactopyranose mutase [Lachnospiraceae bacterium]
MVVGAGLTGAVFAREMAKAGKRCLVIDKRSHVGGNVYTENVDGIQVHRYGPHIFHTDNEKIWKYVNRFADFNHMIYAPLASYGEELYNLPLNMNTFNRLWNLKKPQEVREKIAAQIVPPDEKNALHSDSTVEEQALSLVGAEVYEKLIKGYMEKLWGKDCKDLPASLLPKQPLRFTYDNRYFDDRFQGIPVDGYTALVEKILENTDVMTDTDFFVYRREHPEMFKRVFYTGGIDAYFDYCYGHLEYRSARYETERVEEADYQGNAVVLDMNREVPYTRVIEYKHFAPETEAECPKEYSIISREYPQEWRVGTETNRLQDGIPSAEKNDLLMQDTVELYDPVRDENNNALYEKYRELAAQEKDVIFGGRLGTYQHLDMDQAIAAAMELAQEEKLRFQKKRGKDVSDQAMD